MKERTLSPTEELMYGKCMRLAAESAERRAAEMRKKGMSFEGQSFGLANPWCGLWNAYSSGKATEEDVKACFLLGRVGEEFADMGWGGEVRRDGPLPVNSLPKKKQLFAW